MVQTLTAVLRGTLRFWMQLAGLGGASPLGSGTTCKSPSLFPLAKHRARFPALTSLLLAEVSRAMMGCDLGQREEGRPGSVC